MKNLFSLAAILTVSLSYAQPTIVQSSAPQAGTIWTEVYYENPTGITLGASGASQSWDFSGIEGVPSLDPLSFVAPTSLPSGFDGMFPMADIALYLEEDSTAQFFKIESDGFYIDGFGTVSQQAEPPFNQSDFDPDNLFIPFNFSYPDVRNNESRNIVTFEDGIPLQLRSTIITELTADAYGSITTPGGTSSNVLRMETSSYTIDSIYADTNMDGEFEFISTDGPSDFEVSYFFLQNSEPVVVAIIDMQGDGSTIDSFSYIDAGASDLDENEGSEKLGVFPNPSSGIVHIDVVSDHSQVLSIFDMNGSLIYTEPVNTQQTNRIVDLTFLKAGAYILELVSDKNVRRSKLIIE